MAEETSDPGTSKKQKNCVEIRGRKLRAQLEVLHRSDGSAIVESGDTLLLVAVHGPQEAVASCRLSDKAFLDVQFKPKVVPSLPSGTKNRQQFDTSFIDKVSPLVRGAVESIADLGRFPRTTLQLIVQELNSDGSVVALAVTGACLALMDAGIPMEAIFCGVSIAIGPDDQGSPLILDPNQVQQRSAVANFTFSIKSRAEVREMVGCDSVGRFSFEQFNAALALALQAAEQVFQFYRDTMEKRFSLDC